SEETDRGRRRSYAQERALTTSEEQAQLASTRCGRPAGRRACHDTALGTRFPAAQRVLPRQTERALWSERSGVRVARSASIPSAGRERSERDRAPRGRCLRRDHAVDGALCPQSAFYRA